MAVKKKAAKKVAAKSKAKSIKAKAPVKKPVKVKVKIKKAPPTKTMAKKLGAKVKAVIKSLKGGKTSAGKKTKPKFLDKAEIIQGASNYYLIVAAGLPKSKYDGVKMAVRIGSGGVKIHTHPGSSKYDDLFPAGTHDGQPYHDGGKFRTHCADKAQFDTLFKSWQKNAQLATLPEPMIVSHFKGGSY